MDKRMMQAEFEALPFSEDLYVGQFRYGEAYRHRGDAWNVYIHMGGSMPYFDCFGVELRDNPTIMTVVDNRCHYRRERPVKAD